MRASIRPGGHVDILILIAVIAFAWWLRRDVKSLKADIQTLKARLQTLEAAPVASQPAAEAAASTVETAPADDVPMMPDERGAMIPVPPEYLRAQEETMAAPAPDAAPEPPPPPPAPPPAKPKLEELLTVRWSVWLGAATIGLAGIFLVRYSIEQGWIGPTVRIVLGLLLGASLIGGAEWLRRRETPLPLAGGLRPASITAALASGGVVALYAALYAGYGLYDLYGPLAAFGSLAVVSSLSLGLSLLHGPLLAVIGLVGALLVPGLVSSDAPSAWTLFTYILIVTAAATALARHRGWGWAGWIAGGGAIFWSLAWMVVGWHASDGLPVGLFLLGCAGLFSFGLAGVPMGFAGLSDRANARLALVPPSAMAVLGLFLIRFASYDTASLMALFLIAAILLVRARWREDDVALAIVPLLSALAALALWHLPAIVEQPEALGVVEGRPAGFLAGPIVPPSLVRFLSWCAAFAALFGAAGVAGLWGARRPGFWSGIAVAAPIAVYVIAYWRIEDLQASLPWTAAALALAGLYLALAARIVRYRASPALDAALGAFAVGVTLAVTLAVACTFRLGWMTVAFSIELPVLAWIAAKLDLPALRRIALLLAAVVIGRLVPISGSVLSYPVGSLPILNQLLYTYGLPAIAFAVAARMFARSGRDLLVDVLEGGALAFVTGLVTLEIRHAACLGRYYCASGLGETGSLTLGWGGLAYLLYRVYPRHPTIALRWGWPILATGALVILTLGSLVIENPIWWHRSVGAWPIVNLLLVAFGLPALLAAMFMRLAAARGRPRLATAAGTIALVLGLIYISFEVRHAFRGEFIDGYRTQDAEWYAYSAAWLAYGGALLGLGLTFGRQQLRYASLAIIMLVIAKVFLSDMAELEGLWRALSFLGLGLCLIGVGWLYQRFVFPAKTPAPGT